MMVDVQRIFIFYKNNLKFIFSDDIVQWASIKVSENRPPPEVKQAISSEVVEDSCKNNQLCVIAILPNIIDCQSKCRNNYIKVLKECSEKFKKNAWGLVLIFNLF